MPAYGGYEPSVHRKRRRCWLLIPSFLIGPETWRGVNEVMTLLGQEVVVPKPIRTTTKDDDTTSCSVAKYRSGWTSTPNVPKFEPIIPPPHHESDLQKRRRQEKELEEAGRLEREIDETKSEMLECLAASKRASDRAAEIAEKSRVACENRIERERIINDDVSQIVLDGEEENSLEDKVENGTAEHNVVAAAVRAICVPLQKSVPHMYFMCAHILISSNLSGHITFPSFVARFRIQQRRRKKKTKS